jgi:tetratricopeptide (TPR) repeat protein
MYTELVRRTGKADSHLRYAAFLGRRSRVQKALDECERAREKGPAEEAAATAVAVLRAGSPADEDYRRVEGWLRAGAEKKGKNQHVFLGMLAEFYDQRGDYKQAAACYKDAVDLAPDDAVALNNRAWVLALKENRREKEEALRLINNAIKLAGPHPTLLDTRGIVLLELGMARDAIPDLEQAVALRPTPKGYFRLARALMAVPDRAGAVSAFRPARNKLRVEDLHPLERDEYRRLLPELTN